MAVTENDVGQDGYASGSSGQSKLYSLIGEKNTASKKQQEPEKSYDEFKQVFFLFESVAAKYDSAATNFIVVPIIVLLLQRVLRAARLLSRPFVGD